MTFHPRGFLVFAAFAAVLMVAVDLRVRHPSCCRLGRHRGALVEWRRRLRPRTRLEALVTTSVAASQNVTPVDVYEGRRPPSLARPQ